jgi:hypothetical protein
MLAPQIDAALGFADHLVAARRDARAAPGADEIMQSEKVVAAVRDTTHQMQAEEMRLLDERAARRLTQPGNWQTSLRLRALSWEQSFCCWPVSRLIVKLA